MQLDRAVRTRRVGAARGVGMTIRRPALIVVDMQSGFITDHSRHVIPKVVELIERWEARGIPWSSPGTALGVPILAFPCAKPALTSHPRYADHLRVLTEAGVRITDIGALRNDDGTYRWQVVTELLSEAIC
ncbi:hypothetical protein [Micromonospora sp. NBRC 101691]|uniref:hypothetical protein n=1 Tax=Micromonospora sp. NBRC 101691 TaxID=3032198 RepID=UPI0025573623|nr:hypothetical protein [Micromonospora sp. NBRC 101691]